MLNLFTVNINTTAKTSFTQFLDMSSCFGIKKKKLNLENYTDIQFYLLN